MTERSTLEEAAQRYLMLANQFRSDKPKTANFSVFRGEQFFAPSATLLQLSDAIVMSNEWFVIADGKVHCDAFVHTPSPPLSAYLAEWQAPNIVLMCEQPVELSTEECFLLGGCYNYTHWLLDFLPRIAHYRSDCGPVLTNGPLHSFQIEALAHFDIAPSDLISLDYPRAYKVRKLLNPNTASAISMPPQTFRPSIIDWLRDKFLKSRQRERAKRKLFISRSAHADIHGRRLLNEAELADIARDQGFDIIHAQRLSFETQVELFSQASIITGPHGSGFTNMVFSPRGAKIIEMIGPQYDREHQPGSLSYRKIAALLGQNFIRIVGRPDESRDVHLGHLPFEAYTVDPDEFRLAIRN